MSQMVAAVHITASVVKLLTFGVVLGLQWVCKQRGLVTSGILLLFWALSAIFGAVTFRSVLNSGHLIGGSKVLPLITAAIQYPLVLTAFFLSCWADPKPRYINIDGR